MSLFRLFHLLFYIHILEEPPELLESNLAVPVLVQLLHEGVHLLLRHVTRQLGQLAGVD